MRGLTSTILLVLVLAGLGGYIYFVELKKPVVDPEAKAKAFAVTADQIEAITVAVAGGDTSKLRKSGETWALVEPVQDEADGPSLTSMTSTLASLDIQRVVNEAPTDLGEYGLGPAKVEVTFTAKGGKEYRLQLGDKTPSGGDLFARLPDEKRVFLVTAGLQDTFNRSAFDLRNKMILRYDREKADRFELTRGTTALEASRKDSDWSIAKPIAIRGDYGTLEGVVTSLSAVPMQKIVSTDATNLRQYGLDTPTLTASVTVGGTRHTLLVGGKADGEFSYAMAEGRPAVYTIAPTVISDLSKGLNDLRRKDLFDMRSFTADRVELIRGTEHLTVERSRGKDGKDTWKDAGGRSLDSTKIEDMVTRVSGLRATTYDDGTPAAMKTPVLTVTATFDKGKTETVTFGRADKDIFAARTGEPGTAKLDASSFDEAIKALDALK